VIRMSISVTAFDPSLPMAVRVISEVLDETSHTAPQPPSPAHRHDLAVELDRCLGRMESERSGALPAAEAQVRRAAAGGRMTWAQAAVLVHALDALAVVE
jgi:hypothetical protein